MITALEALTRLRDGNRRFAAGEPVFQEQVGVRRQAARASQAPIAIVVGCSDSRVPAEIVFDQGIGDLFVIRVAGNIVAPSQIGSVEFAATDFGTRLVVVLGHSRCGVIQATLRQLRKPQEQRSSNFQSIVEFVRPSIEPLLDGGLGNDLEALTEQAIRANVGATAERLRQESEIIESLERDDELLIVGAVYSLDTGLVDFFDGVPGED